MENVTTNSIRLLGVKQGLERIADELGPTKDMEYVLEINSRGIDWGRTPHFLPTESKKANRRLA